MIKLKAYGIIFKVEKMSETLENGENSKYHKSFCSNHGQNNHTEICKMCSFIVHLTFKIIIQTL